MQSKMGSLSTFKAFSFHHILITFYLQKAWDVSNNHLHICPKKNLKYRCRYQIKYIFSEFRICPVDSKKKDARILQGLVLTFHINSHV